MVHLYAPSPFPPNIFVVKVGQERMFYELCDPIFPALLSFVPCFPIVSVPHNMVPVDAMHMCRVTCCLLF